MGSKAPVEKGAKVTLRRIMDAGVDESGKFFDVQVEGWEKPALVACRT